MKIVEMSAAQTPKNSASETNPQVKISFASFGNVSRTIIYMMEKSSEDAWLCQHIVDFNDP